MSTTSSKIVSPLQLQKLLRWWRTSGDRVVFTNGCFDLVHLGHVDYLEKASVLGSKLIVGLNSDDSVRRLKGDSRPILNENARSRLLAALECVSAVTIFNEDTPLDLINRVKPDVLVKGNDYKVEEIAGSKEVLGWGGKVELVPLVEGYSTSTIISKIKQLP